MSDEDAKKTNSEAISRWAEVADYSTNFLEKDKKYYRDDLMKDPSFQRAALHYYEMREDKDIGDWENLSEARRQEIASYAYQGIAWFNNNLLIGTTTIGYDVLNGKNTTDDQKIAFQYLMDMYAGASWSKKDVLNFAGQGILADPSTWASLFTGGGSKVAATAAQKLMLEGVKEASERLIKKTLQKRITGKMMQQVAKGQLVNVATKTGMQAVKLKARQVGAVATARAAARAKVVNNMVWSAGFGALDAVATNSIEQGIRTRELVGTSFDGEKYNFQGQNGWSWGQTGQSFVFGAGIGGVFGGAGYGISKTWNSNRVRGWRTSAHRWASNTYRGSWLEDAVYNNRTNAGMFNLGLAGGGRKKKPVTSATSTTPTTSATATPATGASTTGAKPKKTSTLELGKEKTKLIAGFDYPKLTDVPIDLYKVFFGIGQEINYQPYARTAFRILDNNYKTIVKVAKLYNRLSGLGLSKTRKLNRMQLNKVLELDLDAHKYIDPYVQSSSEIILKHFKHGASHPEIKNIQTIHQDISKIIDDIVLKNSTDPADISALTAKKLDIDRVRKVFEAEKAAMAPDLKKLRDELAILQDTVRDKDGNIATSGYKENRIFAIEREIDLIEAQNTKILTSLDEFDAAIDQTVTQLNKSLSAGTASPSVKAPKKKSKKKKTSAVATAPSFNFKAVQDTFDKNLSDFNKTINNTMLKRKEFYEDSYVAFHQKYPPNYRNAVIAGGGDKPRYVAGERVAGEHAVTRRRQIHDGYVNDAPRPIRTIVGDKQSNAEKHYGDLLDIADKVHAGTMKVGTPDYKAAVSSKLAALIREGFDHEAVAGFEHLMWKAGGDGSPIFWYSELAADIQKALKPLYDEKGLDPATDTWLKNITDKIQASGDPEHGFQKGSGRVTKKWIMDNYQSVIMGLRFPANPNKVLAPPGEFPFVSAPVIKFQNRLKAYFGGGKIKKLTQEEMDALNAKGDDSKLAGETVEYNNSFWKWDPIDEKYKSSGRIRRGLQKAWTIRQRAPRWLKAPLNWAALAGKVAFLPVYAPYKVGKWGLRASWNLTKKPLMILGIPSLVGWGGLNLLNYTINGTGEEAENSLLATGASWGKEGVALTVDGANTVYGGVARGTLNLMGKGSSLYLGKDYVDSLGVDEIGITGDILRSEEDKRWVNQQGMLGGGNKTEEEVKEEEDLKKKRARRDADKKSKAAAAGEEEEEATKAKKQKVADGSDLVDRGNRDVLTDDNKKSKKPNNAGLSWGFNANNKDGEGGALSKNFGEVGGIIKDLVVGVKDNLLLPLWNGLMYMFDEMPQGFGLIAGIGTAFLSGKFLFKGGGFWNGLLNLALGITAFVFAKNAAVDGHSQGSNNHLALSDSGSRSSSGSRRVVSNVDVYTSHDHADDGIGALPTRYMNDNALVDNDVDYDTDTDSDGSGDSGGMRVNDAAAENSASMNVRFVSNPGQDAMDAANLVAMADLGQSSGANSQGSREFGGRSTAEQFNREFKGAASVSIYENQGGDSFVPVDAWANDSYERVAHMSHEENGNARIIQLDMNRGDITGRNMNLDPTLDQDLTVGLTSV